ncbi:MAG: N-formylglutamate amidohydrolase [Mangrovimonas sp.]|nr:N-formylglutamate amidohydrolase [Mangrovimonas sp.]
MELYNLIEPKNKKVPIIISSPHSGTFFPDEVKAQLKPNMVAHPDDTDWFIDQLYDFADDMGMAMITANYNRWVIDLNRDPGSVPLYNDGRVITNLVPTTNFNGDKLYVAEEPTAEEIQRRLIAYYLPYHQKIQELIEATKAEFGRVLLFDAHSIRKVVPGIQKDPFPDLILGDNDKTSASKEVIDTIFRMLKNSDYRVEHNHPFKGGHITRSFGNPDNNVHALQLEMAKTNYMDNTQTQYDTYRANKIRSLLKRTFDKLISTL